MCYCIDKDTGMRHREEVFSAVSKSARCPTFFCSPYTKPQFEYNTPRPPASQAPRAVPPVAQPVQPQPRYSFQPSIPSSSSRHFSGSGQPSFPASSSTSSHSKPPLTPSFDSREHPRRTQRLEPPARDGDDSPELDPFDLQPIHEEDDADVDPFEPEIHLNHTLGLSPTPSELELGMGMMGHSRSVGMGGSLSYGMGMGMGMSGKRREHSVDRDSLSEEEEQRQEARRERHSAPPPPPPPPPQTQPLLQESVGDISESQLFPSGSDLF